MTVEQKAKAYDKAIEKLRDFYRDYDTVSNLIDVKEELAKIFHELKESEDERIKKCVKYAIDKLFLKEKIVCDVHKEDVLTWLEKKGNNNNPNWEPSKEQISALEHFVRSIGESGYASPYDGNTKLLYSLLHDLEQLEKQGKQKSIWHNEDEEPQIGSLILLIMPNGNPVVAKIIEPNHTFNHGERWAYIDDLLEATNEAKVDNANEVEPKFKVGDWVVRKDGKNFADGRKTVRITRFDGERYWFDCGTYLQAEDIRLWTIEDAKDGDVLVIESGRRNNECLFIFKDIACREVLEQCYYRTSDNTFYPTGSFIGYLDNIYHPATKEQHKQLFDAMYKAGYEWDAEKKELKKIEQKPVEPQQDMLSQEQYAKAVDECIYGEKSEWSEVDEKMRTRCAACLGTRKEFEEARNWLKSLKDRVQPKQEWSEEDEMMLEGTIDKISDLGTGEMCKEWLKSLKERYTWKPSDEQMNALSKAIAFVFDSNSDVKHSLESLYNELKKL